MNTTMLNLTPELEELIMNNQEKVLLLLALDSLTPFHIKAGDIIRKGAYSNLQRVNSWEEIKTNQLEFAYQVLSMFPDKEDETNQFIDELMPLNGEALVSYLKKDVDFYFLPELSIAFSLDEDTKKQYEVKDMK